MIGRVLLACVTAFVAGGFPAAMAAEGFQQIATLPSKSRVQAGFTMTLETVEVVPASRRGGPGYQPIRVTVISTAGAWPAEREVTLEIRPRNYMGPETTFDFSTTIRLPQGAGSVQQFIYVPQYYPWDNYQCRVMEEGRLFEGGETGLRSLPNAGQNQMVASLGVGILQPGRNAPDDAGRPFPDLRTFSVALGRGSLPEDGQESRLDDRQAKNHIGSDDSGWIRFRVIDEGALYDSWLGYSQLDVLLAPARLLDRIRTAQPERAEEIERWVAAGGSLWIYGDASAPAGEEAARWRSMPSRLVPNRGQVENLLQLQSTNAQVRGNYAMTFGSVNGSDRPRREIWKELQEADHPMTRLREPEEVAAKVRLRDFGAGRVVWIPESDSFPGSVQFWGAVSMAADQRHSDWEFRHGVQWYGDDTYWDWLLESVGRPPVYGFLGLITLFVLLIGPVAYRLLRRAGRLYLLYFVAPAAAFLASAGLFTYGIVADGLGTQARLRQVTVVDGAAQRGTTWSRQTYFSGLPPRGGLRFSARSAVYPLLDEPLNRGAHIGRRARARIRRDGDRQALSGRFLPPRSQQQFVVVRPRDNLRSVRLIRDGEGARIHNATPHSIDEALARDADGVYWRCGAVAVGGEAAATKVDNQAARQWRAGVYNRQPLEPPEGFDGAPSPGMFSPGYRNYYRRMRNSQRSVPAGALQYGLLEEMLQDRIGPGGDLPNGSFVAVAEIDREELGVPAAKVVDSIHFLMGPLR